jgi:hypothetical protein
MIEPAFLFLFSSFQSFVDLHKGFPLKRQERKMSHLSILHLLPFFPEEAFCDMSHLSESHSDAGPGRKLRVAPRHSRSGKATFPH